MPDLRTALSQCPIVAILRGVAPDEIDAIGDALVEAGVTVIEVPLNSPSPFESIRRLAARHGARALIGAGTVLEAADVARVDDAGGKLVVAPNFDADVVRAAKAAGLVVASRRDDPVGRFCGAESRRRRPEAVSGRDHPPAVFKAWRAVFPADTLLLAVGGVGVDNIKSYAEAGASGYGIGSALYKPGRPAAEIGKLSRALLESLS